MLDKENKNRNIDCDFLYPSFYPITFFCNSSAIDSRPLTVAVKNLHLTLENGAECEIYP